jgi:hypothetical protein
MYRDRQLGSGLLLRYLDRTIAHVLAAHLAVESHISDLSG